MAQLRSKLKQSIADQTSHQKFIQILQVRHQQPIKERQIIPSIPLSAFNPQGLPTLTNEKMKPQHRSSSERKFKIAKVQTPVKGIQEEKRKQKSLSKLKREKVEEEKKKAFFGTVSRKNITFKTPNKLRQTGELEVTNANSYFKQTKVSNNKAISQIANQAYDSLVLNLKFGKIQQNAFYKTFMKKQTEIGISPEMSVEKLQKWAAKNRIKSGLIETQNMQKILSKKSIPNYEILCLFSNRQQLHVQYRDKIPGLKFYTPQFPPAGKNLAATKIQSLFRMIFERKYSRKLSSLMSKVKIIQRHWRTCLLMRRNRERILQTIAWKLAKVDSLTKNLTKGWDIAKTSRRIEIHICSYSAEEFKRLTTEDFRQREMSQLTRVFKALQADRFVIFVTPIRLTAEILRYYERIFEMQSKNSFKDKLFFIDLQDIASQENFNYITTASLLYYSSKALNRIKKILKQLQQNSHLPSTAYIVPSYPSNQYVSLASQLNVPIFSGPQHVSKLYSTKSGFKQVLKGIATNEKSSFSFLKSVYTIYTEKQLINTLAVLIHKNKTVEKWYLKIEDEVNSRGLAYLNINSLRFLKQLKKTSTQLSSKEIIQLISDELTLKLKKRLKILTKTVYNSYEQFISHFVTRGGVIEAAPVNKCFDHSISFLIEPNGEFSILGTYSRLQLGGKTVNSSIKYPSDLSPQQIDNEKIVRDLYKCFWLKHKLFGYFSVDLLVDEKMNKNYLIGVDFFLNQKASSMFVPKLLSQTNYNKESNQLIRMKKVDEIQTHCLYYPVFQLDKVPAMQKFFKLCKFSNVAFDLEDKTGTIFLILNEMEHGCFGFLSIADSVEGMLNEVKKVVEFLSREFRKKNKTDEIGMLRGVLVNWLRKVERRTKASEDLPLTDLF